MIMCIVASGIRAQNSDVILHLHQHHVRSRHFSGLITHHSFFVSRFSRSSIAYSLAHVYKLPSVPINFGFYHIVLRSILAHLFLNKSVYQVNNTSSRACV